MILSRRSSYILLDFLNKSHLITQLVMRYLWSNLTLYGAVLPPHLILLFCLDRLSGDGIGLRDHTRRVECYVGLCRYTPTSASLLRNQL